MTPLEFSFESNPWQTRLEQLPDGGRISAVEFLTLLEGQEEAEFEEALLVLNDKHILPDLSDLPRPSGDDQAAVRLRQEEQLVATNSLLTGLEENDPLRLYLQELAAVPVCGDPQLLAERLLQGDKSVTQQLTNLMLSRVVEQAFALAGRGVLLLDLLQEGGLGLWQAILSYEEGNFEAYCCRYIRRSMHKALVLQARAYGVGQKMRQAMEDYRAMDEQLLTDLGRNPTLEELADALHMNVEETSVVAEMLETTRRMNIAKREPEPEEEELAQTQAVEDTAYFQMRQRISDLLSNLDETDAKLLSLRFGLDMGLPMSAEEVGKILGMTAQEVTARETEALNKLRNQE